MRRVISDANKVGISGARKLERKKYNNLGPRYHRSAWKTTKAWQKCKRPRFKKKTKNSNNVARSGAWRVESRTRLKGQLQDWDKNQRAVSLFRVKELAMMPI